jgi:hypothetical protein
MKGTGMKRIALVAAVLGTIIFAFAGVAMAGTGANYGSSNLAGASGNGTAVTHYTASYTDSFFGGVSCTGVHQVKKGAATQDSFTCKSTNGALSNVAPGQSLTLQTVTGWISDTGSGQYATGFSGTVSADGMSYTAVATY